MGVTEIPPNSQDPESLQASLTRQWVEVAIEEGFPPAEAERLAKKFLEPVLVADGRKEIS